MNNARRKAIAKIAATIRPLLEELATLRDEERSAFDNLPESIQQGERGSAAEQAADDLDEAHDEIESACGTLEGIE